MNMATKTLFRKKRKEKPDVSTEKIESIANASEIPANTEVSPAKEKVTKSAKNSEKTKEFNVPLNEMEHKLLTDEADRLTSETGFTVSRRSLARKILREGLEALK